MNFWALLTSFYIFALLCQISSKSYKPRSRYCDFSTFQNGGRRHLEFYRFQINSGDGQEDRTKSPCQISLKSAQTRPRYRDLSIFQDGDRRHLVFSKLQIFNGVDVKEGRSTSPCQISLKSLETQLSLSIMLVWLENAYSRPF